MIRSILITGGTGSFGQAFARSVMADDNIQRICIYSRDEHKQAAMREATPDPFGKLRFFIGDVRDKSRLRGAMQGCDTVIHAAALKRIEVGAYNPDEMVKTNVIGTMNVIEAASYMTGVFSDGVQRVIYLSSDKAFQPISPYGQSKALSEGLILAANNMYGSHGPKFAVTRYGNIWNANGSVVPKWRAMLDAGVTELPVTDLECTRFFMTIGEAVHMVHGLMYEMRGGELVIPDWLPAYRLGDLWDMFRSLSPRLIVPKVTGLPPWEKQHENMSPTLCSRDARRMGFDELESALMGRI